MEAISVDLRKKTQLTNVQKVVEYEEFYKLDSDGNAKFTHNIVLFDVRAFLICSWKLQFLLYWQV